MGIFQQFPYSNFHEFNLDQIIKIMKEMQDEWESTKTEWASYKEFIDNYFENLDVNSEVLQAIRTMASTGELNTVIDPVIASETADWLAEHITVTEGTTVIDDTLSIAGAAADAKAAGDAINNLQSSIGGYQVYDQYLNNAYVGRWWNIRIPKTVANRDKFKFKLLDYSGELFTSCAVGYVSPDNQLIAIKSGIAINTEVEITAPTDITIIYVQLVRSETENNVSAKFALMFKNEGGLYDLITQNEDDIFHLQNIIDFSEVVSLDLTHTNETINCAIPQNSKIYFDVSMAATGSGQYNTQIVYNDDVPLKISYSNESFIFTAPADIYNIRIFLNRVGDFTSLTSNITIKSGLVNDIDELTNNHYTCLKDGSGDFDSLVEAVNAACEHMNSMLYVGPGEWDLVDELGSEYIETVSSNKRGLYLKNRIHVICSSEAIIKCNYTGTRSDTITWLSAFNAGEYGFTLENAHIESSKCRYAIHDERGSAADAYTNKYKNCFIKHDNTAGGLPQCIGGGLGKDGHIVIDGCVFENPHAAQTGIVSYHNTWYDGGDGKSTVEVTGCYFKGTNTFRGSWFGASQEISTFLVHDNSMGLAPIHVVENQAMMDENPSWIVNTEMLAWNNPIR